MIADLDGQHLRAYLAQKGGRTIISAGRGPTEIVTGRSGIVTSFSSAAPTNFGHSLKPDVAAPGGQILSSTLAGVGRERLPVRGLRRDQHVGAARRRARPRCCSRRIPTWTPRQTRSAFVSTAGPRLGQHRPDAGGARRAAGRRPRRRRPRRPALALHLARARCRSATSTSTAARRRARSRRSSTTPAAEPARGRWSCCPQAASAGATVEPDPQVTIPPGGSDRLGVTVRAACRCSRRRQLRLRRAAPRRHHPPHPVLLRGHAARAGAPARRAASGVQHGRHARRRLAREHVPLPVVAVRPAGRLSARPGDDPGRRRGPLHRAHRRARRQLRRRRVVWRATAR